MKNNNFLNQLVLFLIVLIGIIAYEAHIYSYYTIVSMMFFISLSIYISSNKAKKIHIKPFWLMFFIFYFLSYLISVLYNFDIIGGYRLTMNFFTVFVYFFTIRYIDCIFKKLVFLLIPMVVVSFLLQFTSFLQSIWVFIYQRNPSIFFDSNFASAFLGLGALISLSFVENKIIRYFLFVSFSAACFFTFSKAGVFALFLGVLAHYLRRVNIFYSIFFLLMFFLIISYIYINIDLTMFRIDQGLNERDKLWEFVLDSIFRDNNLLGMGASTFEENLYRNGFSNSSTHNYYFDTLLMYGVLPFILNVFLSLSVIYSMILKNSKYLSIFLFLFIQSNSILISFGGIGLLSALITILAVSQIVKPERNESKYIGGVSDSMLRK